MEMNKMNKLLAVAAGIEVATGLVLMINPSIVTRLLLGAEIFGVAIVLGRVSGFGLLSFGLACWPDRNAAGNFGWGVRAMLTYSVLCTLYLLYLGIDGEWAGYLLWPAVVWHGAVTFLLAISWFKMNKAKVKEWI
jgi:hypothetical protein